MRLRQIAEDQEEFDYEALLRAAEEEYEVIKPKSRRKPSTKVKIPKKERGPYKQRHPPGVQGTALRGGSWSADVQRDRRVD